MTSKLVREREGGEGEADSSKMFQIGRYKQNKIDMVGFYFKEIPYVLKLFSDTISVLKQNLPDWNEGLKLFHLTHTH